MTRSRRPAPHYRAPADGDPSTAENRLHEGEAHDSDDRRIDRGREPLRGPGRSDRHDNRRGRRDRRRATGRGTLGGAPPRQTGRAGLVEGRPRHQRHDGRGRPAPASVPRNPGPRDDPGGRPLHPRRTARRRHLEHLLRRAGRPLRHDRGVRRPAAGRGPPRRTAHGTRLRLGQGAGRHRGRPRLHPYLAGPVRLVEVGRPPRTAARADVLPQVGPAQHLRLRLLGPADHRAAHRRLRQAPGAPRALRPGRAAHRPRPPQPGQEARPARQLGRDLPAPRQRAAPLPQGRPAPIAPYRDEPGRPVDHRAPGERRLLGRDPAARRLLRHRPAPARLRPRPPGDEGGPGLARPVRRPARGRRPHGGGLPVARLGHLSGHHRPGRRRTQTRPPGPGEGRRLDARRGDHQTR